MNSSRIAVVILFILCSVANFLGYTGRHDALCLDNVTVRLEWCYPGRHLLPTFNATAFAREIIVIALAGIAWVRVSKKPA